MIAVVVISPAITASPVVTNVSHATRPLGVLSQNFVQYGIGNLVGDLVGVAFGDRFGGKQEIA